MLKHIVLIYLKDFVLFYFFFHDSTTTSTAKHCLFLLKTAATAKATIIRLWFWDLIFFFVWLLSSFLTHSASFMEIPTQNLFHCNTAQKRIEIN